MGKLCTWNQINYHLKLRLSQKILLRTRISSYPRHTKIDEKQKFRDQERRWRIYSRTQLSKPVFTGDVLMNKMKPLTFRIPNLVSPESYILVCRKTGYLSKKKVALGGINWNSSSSPGHVVTLSFPHCPMHCRSWKAGRNPTNHKMITAPHHTPMQLHWSWIWFLVLLPTLAPHNIKHFRSRICESYVRLTHVLKFPGWELTTLSIG